MLSQRAEGAGSTLLTIVGNMDSIPIEQHRDFCPSMRRLIVETNQLNLPPIHEATLQGGFIVSSFIATTKGRVKFLQLSDKGKQLIESKESGNFSTKGGPEHEYWKHKIAEKLRAEGYELELEKQTDGHYADIVAKRDGKTMAVEVESGKSDAEESMGNDSRSRI